MNFGTIKNNLSQPFINYHKKEQKTSKKFINFTEKMKATFKQKFKYFFDSTLSRGTASIVIWLSIITFFLVLFFAIIYLLIGISFEDSGQLNFYEAFWQSLMRSLDPGTVAGDTIWPLRIIGIIITISGIFILSSLIGILSSGLETKLEQLRKGKSLVLTENHTLVIGWSPKIIQIISQLIIANENQKKPSIVILANKDKIEMEDEIRDKIKDRKNTKIICRTGNALETTDLRIANPDKSKSIIILAPDNVPEDIHDIHVIKTILSITYNTERKKEKYHIVAEIRNKENLDAAEIVGKDEVSLIFDRNIVSRLTAQTCHQSGLSIIYMDLLAYEGDEIYTIEEPKLVGKSYKDLVFAYEDSSVIGIIKKNGKVLINPPFDLIYLENEKLIAISEDDDTVIMSKKNNFNINQDIIIKKEHSSSARKEKNLILGWNSRALMTVEELDNYVSSGSELVIVTQNDEVDSLITTLEQKLLNQKIEFKKGNYSKRNVLLGLNLSTFDNIIVMSNEQTSPQVADSITILALIHIRNIAKEQNFKINIISEMFDQKNRELAEITEANDFIISHDFISRLLTQVSENKKIKEIFNILFESEGSEIYLKNISEYIDTNQAVNFYTLLESAAFKNETAIGYRIMKYEHFSDKNYGIKVNPKKSEFIKFSKEDKIIVLAED